MKTVTQSLQTTFGWRYKVRPPTTARRRVVQRDEHTMHRAEVVAAAVTTVAVCGLLVRGRRRREACSPPPPYRRRFSEQELMLQEFREISKEIRIDRMYVRVAQAIRRMLPVDRATVFLVNREAGSEGWQLREATDVGHSVVVPIGTGVAGSVALPGKSETVSDAYADPRFDQSTDGTSGFRTRSRTGS